MHDLQIVSLIVTAVAAVWTLWATATTWEVSGFLLLVVTLLGGLMTVVWHSSKLATRLENAEAKIKEMQATRDSLVRNNDESHRRLWEQINVVRQVASDNATRISYIEDRSGITRKAPRRRNTQGNPQGNNPHGTEDTGRV